MLHPHPGNCLIGEIDVQNVVGVAEIRLDRRRVFIQRWMPLVAVAAEESIKMLEAETSRPQVERTRLARHPVRYIVHLAKPRRVVAILPEHSSDRTGAV